MNKKYLVLKGCAGLGNRLFTLANAIAYAKKTSRVIYVDWADGQFAAPGKNAFYEYFSLTNVEHITSIDEISGLEKLSVYPKLWKTNKNKGLYDLYVQDSSDKLNKIPRKLVPKGSLRKIYGCWQPVSKQEKAFNTDMHALKSVFSKDSVPLGGHYSYNLASDVVFFSDFMPCYNAQILRDNIVLQEPLKNKLLFLRNELFKNKKITGIHVRATDKQPTQSVKKLAGLLKQTDNADNEIFLATDNKEVENILKESFPETITLKKFLPEKHSEGLHQYALYNHKPDLAERLFEESVLDMWLLSLCDKLYYQGNSSFSIMSKEIKNNPACCFDWQKLVAG